MTGVRTAPGTIACDAGGGGRRGRGAPRSRPTATARRCGPVKGQILELRARGAVREPLERDRAHAALLPGRRAATAAWCWARRWRSRASTPTVTADGVFRLLEAAWEVLPEVGELELVRARAPACGPGTPDNPPVDRARASSTGSSGPPATGATACCWRRSPARRWPACSPATSRRELAARSARALRDGGGARVTVVTLNGEPRELPNGATVRGRRASRPARADGRGVAVARRRRGGAARRVGDHRGARGPAGRGAPRGAGRLTARRSTIAGRELELAPDPRHRRLPQPRGDGRGGARVGRRARHGGDAPRRPERARLDPRGARGGRARGAARTPPAASRRARP